MPTWKAVKHGSGRADVDPSSATPIYDEATHGLPPKGVYRFVLKRLQVTETSQEAKDPGTPMLKCVCEISEPSGTKKAIYNGYSTWLYRVDGEADAARVNAFLLALLGDTKLPDAKKKTILSAYHDRKVVIDEEGFIQKIGTWAVPETINVGANTRHQKNREGDLELKISELLSIKDAPEPVVDEEADEIDEDTTEEVEAEEGEEDPAVAERAEELEGMTLAKLKTVAKGLGAKLAEYKALEEADLIEFILDLEFPPEDGDEEEAEEAEEESEEDAEEVDEEPDGDEFTEMTRADLKKVIKAEGIEIRITTKTTDDELRDAIRAALPEDDAEPEEEEPEEEEAEEEEPEPEAKPARRPRATPAAKARPAASRRRGQKGDPPF